jgi:hypothetical protein
LALWADLWEEFSLHAPSIGLIEQSSKNQSEFFIFKLLPENDGAVNWGESRVQGTNLPTFSSLQSIL